MDVIGVDLAGRDEFLHLDQTGLARRRHHRIEVPRRLSIDEVTRRIALPGLDDRQIRRETSLHHVMLAVEGAGFLALGDHGAVARLGVEGRNARPACTDALGQRALRIEFELKLARKIELFEQLVLPDVRTDHLADLTVFQEQAQAKAVHAAVVGDHRQVLHPVIADRRDQVFRDPAKAKAARHDGHAVEEKAFQRLGGVGDGFG